MKSGFTIWLTGVPGAGKSTMARLLSGRFRALHLQAEVLDGDLMRTTLCRGLGFSREDRDENVRRVGFVCEVLSRNGIISVAAVVSPYRAARDELRTRIPNFIEVHVDCPLKVLVKRDERGLYQRALAGEIANFTGISDLYEPPLNPEVRIDTAVETPQQSLEKIWALLAQRNLAGASSEPAVFKTLPAH